MYPHDMRSRAGLVTSIPDPGLFSLSMRCPDASLSLCCHHFLKFVIAANSFSCVDYYCRLNITRRLPPDWRVRWELCPRLCGDGHPHLSFPFAANHQCMPLETVNRSPSALDALREHPSGRRAVNHAIPLVSALLHLALQRAGVQGFEQLEATEELR